MPQPPTHLDIHLDQPRALVLQGANFSGRSDMLRAALGQVGSGIPRCLIPPEADEVVSGLAVTTEEELQLGLRRDPGECRSLATDLAFACDPHQNPLTLSGGEKVLLVALAAFCRGCRLVGLDVALEQLDIERRRRFFTSIPVWLQAGTSLLIADNRIDELALENGNISGLFVQDCPQALRAPELQPLPVLPEPDTTCEAIRFDGISFGYTARRAILRDGSATLRPGAAYHLEGANGSGKSTLAKLIIGRLRASQGTFVYGGAQIDPWRSPGRFAAYHFQDPDVQLFTTQVGLELQAAATYKTRRRDDLVRALSVSFGLQDYLEQHPFDLPFVLRKRLALAATLATNAPWFILDEPTLGQDQASARTIAGMIQSLVRQGRGVIVISHSPSFIDLFEPIAMSLEAGRLRSAKEIT